ncbi:hypothetical protein ASPWEDRAFT_111079 [Aspergillus wentii DTO 134E9]|uniref:Metallo-beta-lactamase domain-containing protein n=1 Tax=Aspergillus wentii DTO 134E9 TaxID=1073089 RepID=A0A1L9RKV5_ASPWE|nr:uncharacterized protein ASPWEDRAFT_111079 [Aspergillus wentii DTO 134E9]OJJ35566.1 hypothetical protein ASPWEDRAFT_111079 [Aspergillus wentii DTO 134E9]
MFDLGVRKDWENSPEAFVAGIKDSGGCISVDKDVATLLRERGQDLGEIGAIIWSHWHFDHAGDPQTFPTATDLIVGPGFKANIMPGFRALYEKVCVGNKGEDAQSTFFEVMLLEEGFGRGQPWHGRSRWSHPDYVRKSAHRKTLFDIMTGFIPIENVKFDKRLTHVEQRPAGVTLTFSDGTTAEAAILAGADGIRSTTREHILKDLYPSQVAPVYAGAYCYRAVIPMPEAYEILGDLTDVAKLYFGPKRGVASIVRQEFNYLLCVADSDEGWKLKDAVTERTTHEAMMADFEDPGIDESFRKLLQRAKPVKWGLFHHLHTATYFRDRVVLIQWVSYPPETSQGD